MRSAFKEYKTHHPRQGCVEQKPLDWWAAVVAATREVMGGSGIDAGSVAGIGLSGQMCGCVPVDDEGDLLREYSMIWSDSRSLEQIERIMARVGPEKWYMLTGGGLRPENYSSPKIAWLRENEPDLYRRTYKFIGTKDYILMRMTGAIATDYGEASSTALLDLQRRDWSPELLEAAGILPEKLPVLHESTDVVGEATPKAARELGIKPGTPVVAGSGDTCATTVGAGAVAKDQVYCCMGTSSFISYTSTEPMLSLANRPYVFCHPVPGLYVSSVSIYCGGQAYRWIRDVMCQEEYAIAARRGVDVYEVMNEEAGALGPGANKLLFIPHLMGGSTIHKSPFTRGAFVGLGVDHTRQHLIRSVLEGTGLALRQVMEIFEDLAGIRVDELVMVGGGAKSVLWRQIMADVMNKRVLCAPRMQDAGALGVAVIAGIGVGLFKGFEVVGELVRADSISRPRPERVRVYERLYPLFCRLSNDLVPTFEGLAGLDE